MKDLQIDRNVTRWALLIVAVIGLIALGVILLIDSGKFTTWSYVSLGVAVAATAAYIWFSWGGLTKTAAARSGQYALTSVLLSISFVVFVIFIYVIVAAAKLPHLKDLTELQKYTLSQKTVTLLGSLKEDVHIIGFYTEQQATTRSDAETWLKQYQQYSNGKITYEFVDPDRDPVRSKALGATRSGTILVKRGDQKAEASSADEQGLTNALVQVLSGKARKAYVIIGHGERTPDDVTGQGLSQAKTLLGNVNITFDTLNILEKKAIPDDADLIIVTAPTSQFAPVEVDAISAYLAKGKGALFMFEPGAGGGTLSGGVISAAFNNDGSRIATAGSDGTARIWDAASGKELATLRGNAAEVTDVAFSPDGKQVVTASADNTVRVWDAQTGEQVAKLEGKINGVRRIAFSPDGRFIAAVGTDQNVNVWDASSRQPASYSPISLSVPLIAMAFSPDSSALAVTGGGSASGAAGSQATIFIRDTASGKEVLTKTLPTNTPVDLAYSADGKLLYDATFDGTLGTLDVATGAVTSQTLYSADLTVTAFSLLGDGSQVFALGDGTIHIHPASETSSDKDVVLKEHTGRVWALKVSADGKSFVSASRDGSARVWKVGQAASSLQLSSQSTDPLLDYLKSKWGITVEDDVVVDLVTANATGGSPYSPISYQSSQYDQISPITHSLVNPPKQIGFSTARSIAAADTAPDGVLLTKLVTTSAGPGESWGETNPPENRAIDPTDFDPATDKPGPVALGVSGENSTTKGRVIVFGDADFASDTALQRSGAANADLVVNSANWLSSKTESISLPSTNVGVRTIDNPPSPAGTILLLLGTTCALPGLLLIVGGVVWFTRQRRR